MALFGIFKQKEKIDLNETPVEEKVTRPIRINKAKMKDFVIKAIGNITNQSDDRERFERPEYNL